MDEKAALNQAMKLCSRKEYSAKEMLDKLLEWELPEEKAAQIVKTLISDKFIDDQRYTRAFVNDKLKFSKWGKIKISYMLKQKGVASDIVKETLNDIDEQLYEEILLSELTKKAKSIKAESDYEFKGKLIQFAAGRGFEYEVAAKLAERLIR
jgi:regulatory protein